MSVKNILCRVADLYVDGFRNMTLGRTLWAIIFLKLLIVLVVMKLLFFPNFLSSNAEEGKEADFVMQEISGRR